MKKLIFFLLISAHLFGQRKDITYVEDIKPIISKNCIYCHSPNNVGPFSLLEYVDLKKRGTLLKYVTGIKYMPPFPADRTFQSYKNERGLNNAEIDLIASWVNTGMKEGKKKKKKNENQIPILKPDITLQMQEPYSIIGNNEDDFRFFHIKSNLPEDKYIQAIGFKPGNKKGVHHSRIMVDTTNQMQGINGMSEKDEKIYEFQKYKLKDEYLFGWVPGNDRIEFPAGSGLKLNKNSDFLLNMHYSPSPINKSDQSSIVLDFSNSKINREVKSLILRENDISNKPFEIKSNSNPKFFISKNIDKDISLISILPHMHQLGESFRSFVITKNGEVINLLKIDSWDFNWQMTYQFKTLIKIPKGSTLIVEVAYNNSPSEKNPNPIDVKYGWRTQDEMLNVVLYYLDYQPKDETIKQ
jgi:Copper type II ascorbate-dependent monooxygenase, C-terminal domain